MTRASRGIRRWNAGSFPELAAGFCQEDFITVNSRPPASNEPTLSGETRRRARPYLGLASLHVDTHTRPTMRVFRDYARSRNDESNTNALFFFAKIRYEKTRPRNFSRESPFNWHKGSSPPNPPQQRISFWHCFGTMSFRRDL